MGNSLKRGDKRLCSKCGQEKPLECFYGDHAATRNCRDCTRIRNKINYHANKKSYRNTQRKYEQKTAALAQAGDKTLHAKSLINGCRTRAKRNNLPFDITYLDIPVPEFCPALGIKLNCNKGKIRDDSATVDKINPELGYVRGNVIVVSNKANRIKTSATPQEVMQVAAFYLGLIK